MVTPEAYTCGEQGLVAAETPTQKIGFVEQIRTHKNKVMWAAAGAIAIGSMIATAVSSNYDRLKDQALEIAPWAGTGFVASEAVFAAGGLLMLAALGKKAHNLFKVRGQVAAFNEDAKSHTLEQDKPLLNSSLFKLGFALNAVGALGTAGVAIAAVTELPREAWGLMAPAFLDILATVSIRSAVWSALRTGKKDKEIQ